MQFCLEEQTARLEGDARFAATKRLINSAEVIACTCIGSAAARLKDLSFGGVLIDEAGTHVRSTAALRVLARCAAPFSYMAVLLWLPRPLRDLGYKGVAAVRYRVFGQDDGASCRRLTKTMRKRFLDH